MATKNEPGDAAPHRGRPAVRLADLARRSAVRRQRRVWSGRVANWDKHGSANLTTVTAAVIAVAGVQPGDVVLDLGAGHGQVSLPLAMRGARVLGIDVSPGMVSALRSRRRVGQPR